VLFCRQNVSAPDGFQQKGAAGVGFQSGSDLVEIGFDDQRNQLCGFPVFPENLFPGIPVMAIDQKKRSRGENEEKDQGQPDHIRAFGQPGKGFGSMVLFRGHEAPYGPVVRPAKRPTILGPVAKKLFSEQIDLGHYENNALHCQEVKRVFMRMANSAQFCYCSRKSQSFKVRKTCRGKI